MRSEKRRYRWLCTRLPSAGKRRLVVLTGARQTGKTTLARHVYADLRYLNLDAIEEREALRSLRSTSWGRAVGAAVIDEAQKEPGVFDKVKLAYDERQIAFSILLGSSRVLLLDRVRESLAGRAFVYDLWPLMASELRHADHEVRPRARCSIASSRHRSRSARFWTPSRHACLATRRRVVSRRWIISPSGAACRSCWRSTTTTAASGCAPTSRPGSSVTSPI